MLRAFRPRDIPELVPLLLRHFPEEEAVLGRNPETYARIVRRIYRWDARLVLGLLRAVGRPVFRFLVVEADGRLAATTIVTFPPAAGFLSTVMVDTPYRRRGYARRLVEAACHVAARRGRRVAALDVLAANAPAQALYASLGFRRLRGKSLLLREGARPSDAGSSAGAEIRTFRRSDGSPLVALAAAALPPSVAAVFPATEGELTGRDLVASILESETAAWVAEVDGAPAGYVSASASAALDSGFLRTPLVGPRLDDANARALVTTAVAWLADHQRSRVVVEVPDHAGRSRRALESEGFREVYRVDTLARAL